MARLTIVAWMFLVFALLVSGAAASPNVTLRHRVIEIRRGVAPASLIKRVLGVSKGARATDVRSTFGVPFTKVSFTTRLGRGTCWAYHAHEQGTSIDALSFCINGAGRVEKIEIGYHL